jgi:hypothetical protein
LIESGQQARQTFTRALQTYKVKVLDAGSMLSPCQFLYKVPPTLCQSYKLSSDQSVDLLSASAALAVLDDLSAYGIVASDRKLRPGVSVSLSTDIFAAIRPGDEVICSFQTDKIGKFLGFQTMELLDPLTNKPLARGKHIKFMPMGLSWELAFSHTTMSQLIHIHDNLHDRSLLKRLTQRLAGHDQRAFDIIDPSSVETAGLYKALGLEKSANHEHEYKLKLRRGMNMILGQMHGGAAAMSVEAAANSILNHDSKTFLQSMQLTYLTALKGNFRINCSMRPSDGESVKAEGGIYREDDRKSPPLVQYQASWLPAVDALSGSH